ncbi:MAG: hypothetical protein K0Q55_2836 [Verrucomicrobia bacterium]|jgi:hypothetical protein|nr:hypothetical protein [Verrucomicrobiota bacterium]
MSTPITPEIHRRLAVDLFNQTWTLMEKPDRTAAERDAMIHGAHASCHHWSLVGNATNLSIGEWQISRVYAVLKRPEPALYHAHRCLEISEQNKLPPFNLGYAHEAIARALSLTNHPHTAKHLEQAKQHAAAITDPEDQKVLLTDLETIPQSAAS